MEEGRSSQEEVKKKRRRGGSRGLFLAVDQSQEYDRDSDRAGEAVDGGYEAFAAAAKMHCGSRDVEVEMLKLKSELKA